MASRYGLASTFNNAWRFVNRSSSNGDSWHQVHLKIYKHVVFYGTLEKINPIIEIEVWDWTATHNPIVPKCYVQTAAYEACVMR